MRLNGELLNTDTLTQVIALMGKSPIHKVWSYSDVVNIIAPPIQLGQYITAKNGDEVLGYVCGYVTPEDEKCLLITEIVVLEAARNKGLAGALLANLAQDWNGIITTMKTTIVASNTIAQALFNGYAEKNGHAVTTEDFITAKDFGKDEKHETEVMYTIAVK